MTAIITVENLRKTYGTTVAVADISFEVSEGEIFGLLGPNGAGKTTTVEILQALRSPDAGIINVLGLDPRHEAAALRRQIGSQLQESALPDRLKVWEALDLFASVTPDALDWPTLLEQWGLADWTIDLAEGWSALPTVTLDALGNLQRMTARLKQCRPAGVGQLNPVIDFLSTRTSGS